MCVWFQTRPNAASLKSWIVNELERRKISVRKTGLEKNKPLVKTALIWLCSNFPCWQRGQLKKVLLGFAGLSVQSALSSLAGSWWETGHSLELLQSPAAQQWCKLFNYSTLRRIFSVLIYSTAQSCFWVPRFWLENIHPSDLWELCSATSSTLLFGQNGQNPSKQ